MLFSLSLALLPFSCVWARPKEPLTLSIPVDDIIKKDLSAHHSHPNFPLYTRWLESPIGSYVQRDPKAAFKKHAGIATIDCYSETETCLLTSRVAFSDLVKTDQEVDSLTSALEAELQARDGEKDPATLFAREVEKHSAIGKRSHLIKRTDTRNLLTSTHLKTYHDLGPNNPSAGYQHYITWDLKVCRTKHPSWKKRQDPSNSC